MEKNQFYYNKGRLFCNICVIPYYIYFLFLFIFLLNQGILLGKENWVEAFGPTILLIANLFIFASTIPIVSSIFTRILNINYLEKNYKPFVGKFVSTMNFCFYLTLSINFLGQSFIISFICLNCTLLSIFSLIYFCKIFIDED